MQLSEILYFRGAIARRLFTFRQFMMRAVIAVLLLGHAALGAESMPDFSPQGRAFLEKHCLKCHSGAEPEAGLSLEAFRESETLVRHRKVWDNALKMITSSEMPPADSPRPSVAEAEAFTSLVRSIFDEFDRNAKPDPGRVTMRRLNRVEYRNTIRDLIGIDFDPTTDFPSDDIGHGFDNIGDVLTISPVLMERYLAAADTIMSRAITPKPAAVIKRHLSARYSEPASGDVEAKVIENGYRRLSTDGTEAIETGPINTAYQWEDDGEYIFRAKVYGESGTDRPVRVAILVHGTDLTSVSTEEELAALSGNVLKPAKLLQTIEVKANTREKPEVLEVRIPAMTGRHRVLVAQYRPDEGQPASKLFVEYLALEGPLDTRPASQRRLLHVPDGTDPEQRTRIVLSRFLRRSFRRTPTPDELTHLLDLANAAEADGESWESAMQLAMQAVLCSPKFLFRVELDDSPESPEVRPLNEFQLASRLSYFLWSSMPDDILLDLAEQGQLSAQLEAQVKRMLQDPRSASLVQNFAMQWLQIQRIEFISPDGTLFPTFNDKLRTAMLKETELFVDSIVREDRSILELIDADYTFLNEPLARHYGIADTNGNPANGEKSKPPGEPIRGDEFRRVSLASRTRGGLLTQASVLTVTSNPTRTSPVKRGRWVLEQILGAPPPPPPPNVPELPSTAEDAAGSSLRERMEIHRRNPSCANCHAKMDPIGFSLENFNAVGAYRTKDGAFEVDATGEFADGTKFTGPAELKSIVLNRKVEFRRCLTEKLLIYALGRGLEYYDRPSVENIVQSLEAGDDKVSVLITQIVMSDPFRQRRGLISE